MSGIDSRLVSLVIALAACAPNGLGDAGEDEDTSGEGETDESGESDTGDGDGEGPLPFECDSESSDVGEHLWTQTFTGSAEFEDEARGVDIDGAGRVLVGGVTRTSGSSLVWNPYLLEFDGTGELTWSEQLASDDSQELHDVAWIGSDAFVSAGGSRMGATVRGWSGQAVLEWEHVQPIPGQCDPRFDRDAAYVDVAVGEAGFVLGLFGVEDIGDLCYEVEAHVEARDFAGNEVWRRGLTNAVGEPHLGRGSDVILAAAGGELYGLAEADGSELWSPGDVPPATLLASGASGKLVSVRADNDTNSWLAAERDAAGAIVWQWEFADFDLVRVSALAIDPLRRQHRGGRSQRRRGLADQARPAGQLRLVRHARSGRGPR